MNPYPRRIGDLPILRVEPRLMYLEEAAIWTRANQQRVNAVQLKPNLHPRSFEDFAYSTVMSLSHNLRY